MFSSPIAHNERVSHFTNPNHTPCCINTVHWMKCPIKSQTMVRRYPVPYAWRNSCIIFEQCQLDLHCRAFKLLFYTFHEIKPLARAHTSHMYNFILPHRRRRLSTLRVDQHLCALRTKCNKFKSPYTYYCRWSVRTTHVQRSQNIAVYTGRFFKASAHI